MNPDTGAAYPIKMSTEGITLDGSGLSQGRVSDLEAEVEEQETDELVQLAGSPEKLAEAVDALKQHAKSKGTHDPGQGLTRRELRRYLERTQ